MYIEMGLQDPNCFFSYSTTSPAPFIGRNHPHRPVPARHPQHLHLLPLRYAVAAKLARCPTNQALRRLDDLLIQPVPFGATPNHRGIRTGSNPSVTGVLFEIVNILLLK
jgi:hypothetical protein